MVTAIKSWRICASSLATLVLVAVLASCGSATPDNMELRPINAQPAPHMLKQLSRMQRHSFALLRTSPEGLPSRAHRLARAAKTALNPVLAQRIPVTAPGSYWLVPGINHLCIVSEVPFIPGIGAICARTHHAVKHGLGTISFTPARQAGAPTRQLVGIAPDDARAAVVHTRRSVAVVPVVDGVFVLRDSLGAPSDFIELRRTPGPAPRGRQQKP